MEAETRRKIEETVLDILKKSNIEQTTEFTIRVAASDQLGIDLSAPETKQLVRNVVESYLLTVAAAADDKPPQEESRDDVQPNREMIMKKEKEDSERVICQVGSSKFNLWTTVFDIVKLSNIFLS